MKGVLALLFLTILHGIAIFLFGSGFLLTRSALDNFSEPAADQPAAIFSKAVILVIDALRFDFTVPQNDSSHYWNHLTVLHEVAQAHPRNALLTKFIADPPTTTLQRLKGLTTGSLPTFVDAGSNFAGDAIDEDNLVSQLLRADKRIAFVGDDTWQALFPNAFVPDLNYPFESLNVWDLDTVDNGVHHHLFEAEDSFFGSSRPDWDIVIAHALGLDHAGHRYGPSHPETTRKLLEMDSWVRELITNIDDETILIIMGDHGMNPQGDHGGDSIEELEAALFMYSRKQAFTAVDKSVRNRGVWQIDFVSTFALLLGIPIPFNNLGIPIPAAFSQDARLNHDFAVQLTARQIRDYIAVYQEQSSSMKQFLSHVPVPDEDEKESLLQWQRQVLEIFRQQWAQYHIPSIIYGLLFMAAIILLQVMLLNCSRYIMPFQFLLSLLPACIFYILRSSISFHLFGMATSIPLIILAFVVNDQAQSENVDGKDKQSSKTFYYSLSGLGALVVHAAIFASNSFTIHEDRIALFLSATLLVPLLLSSFARKGASFSACALCAALCASRLVASVRLCREEQAGTCVSSFYSFALPYALPIAILTALLLSVILKRTFVLMDNLVPSARQWLRVCDCCLHGAWLYWLLDSSDYSDLKLALARVIVLIVSGLSLVWWFVPLPISFSLHKGQLVAKGLSSAVSSTYLQLILPLCAVLIALSRLVGSLSIMILLLQLLALSYVFAHVKLPGWYQIMVYFELSFLHFFSTGHQMALPFIQWDMAFFLSKSIIYPMSPMLVAGNAFASFIVTVLFLPLMNLFISTTSHKRKDDRTYKFVGFMTAMSVVTFSTMLFATHFRRHLMVWKIFAPRFMCASLILLMVDVTCILAEIGYSASVSKLIRLGKDLAPSAAAAQ